MIPSVVRFNDAIDLLVNVIPALRREYGTTWQTSSKREVVNGLGGRRRNFNVGSLTRTM
eukprot:m.178469 g.178469  ORF g.178469 m.178469 type:complete len:59 (+) comp53391_c0_seq12:634-810(+)